MNGSRFKDGELDDMQRVLGIYAMPDIRQLSHSEIARYEVLKKVRDAVRLVYQGEGMIEEIEAITKIYPNGPQILASAQSIEEFTKRVNTIYQAVLAGQTGYEERKIPKGSNESWPWYKVRRFNWTDDKSALRNGFPDQFIITNRTMNFHTTKIAE